MTFNPTLYRAQVLAHARRITGCFKVVNPGWPPLVDLQKVMDAYAAGYRPESYIHWDLSFIAIASGALRLYQERGKTFDPEAFADLLTRKSQAYGSKSLTRWGLLGVIMRIDAKVSRAANLLGTDVPQSCSADEAVEDTIIDIFGYCVLARMMISKEIV